MLNNCLAYILDRLVAQQIGSTDIVFITGFWRSGTTWLQQLVAQMVAAKTVFEPLDPNAYAILGEAGPYGGKGVSRDETISRLFMPHATVDGLVDPKLTEYLDRAVHSDLPGPWVRRARKGLLESLRRRVVVKLVRGQLAVEGLASVFNAPVIHVRRDPRAVIASVRRGGWGQGWLENFSLKSLFLEYPDGREAVFKIWQSQIEQYDGCSNIERLAAFWALTEWYIDSCRDKIPEQLSIVDFGLLQVSPWEVLSQILGAERLKLRNGEDLDSLSVSPTANRDRRQASKVDRASGWRNELTAKEVVCIEKVITHFSMEKVFQ